MEVLLKKRGKQDLINPFERGWTIPVDKTSFNEIIDSLDEITYQTDAFKLEDMADRISDKSKSYDARLAARLPTHEVLNLSPALDLTLAYVKISPDAKTINNLIACLANIQQINSCMNYLASGGNEKFLSSIPVSQLEHLLLAISGIKDTELQLFGSGCIQNAEYIALYQLVKNSPTDCKVIVNQDSNYKTLSVRDFGDGIRNKKGFPISPENLHDIFGKYSTNGRGLGLQIAKRLSHLRGGYIEVTTNYGDHSISYSTLNNKYSLIQNKSPHGTNFTLNIPK